MSVVIPAYNEERNLKRGVLAQVAKYLETVDYPYEVLIVDDGSQDKTAFIISAFIKDKKNFRLIKNFHGGKALAVMTGLMKAGGEIALFTDMDQATPIDQIGKILPYFAKSYDVVIGSRRGRKGAPILRKLAAWGFAFLRNVILGLPYLDTQCGFKAFNKRARKAIFPRLFRIWTKMKARGAAVHAGFDVETLFVARKLGFKIAEVEVDWHYVGTERVQLIRDSIDAIKDLLRIRTNDTLGKYAK